MKKQFPCPVTTIFSRRVKPGSEAAYEDWLRGINQVSAGFSGSQGTTVVKPDAKRGEFVAIVQFDSTANLENWLTSPQRAAWLAKLKDITLDSEEVASLTGMERWFTLPDRSVTQAPPKFKSAVLVLVGLYPLSMLLAPLLSPLTEPVHPALQTLISQAIAVPIMVYLVMPQLTRLFFRWLYPEQT